MKEHPFRTAAVVAGSLAVFFAFAGLKFFRLHPLPLRAEAALFGCLLLLLCAAALPAISGRRPKRPWALMGLWCVPYLIYAAGTGDFRWSALARLLAVCVPPVLIYAAAPVRNPAAFAWQDAIAWTWLVMAVVLRQLNGIWTVPASLDFMARLFVIGVASWCWVWVRPVPALGYRFELSVRTLRAAALSFAGFAVIAIPASFAMRFAGWHPQWRGWADFASTFVEILVFIAWLEELFFRGFLQSLLARSLESAVSGQLLASLAFGLSHILLPPAPNWRYVLLASIAGWFYGSAFRRSGSLVGPALAHALVDTAWRTWFRTA